MPRKKKSLFKLDPEWLLKEPLDFEYNKYTLLDYLQKCEQNFDKLEIYPDFVELSLHLANIQSLVKENTLLLTKKKFESPDDEILLKELYPKKPRELTKDEEDELDKTIKFSGGKLFDAFNIAKSIWNVAYDNIHLSLRKNKENLHLQKGYIFYYKRDEDKIIIWEYDIKKLSADGLNTKTTINQIYENTPNEINLATILETFSKWNTDDRHQEFPVFEMKSNQSFPMEATMVPIMKRKLLAYTYQVINHEKLKNFDSQV